MNQTIQKMKTALSAYYNKAKEISPVIDRMKKELLPDVAAERAEKLYQDLNAIRYNAKEQIRSAAAEGRAAAEKWGMLNGSDLTDDAKLLQAGLTLTQKDFDDLCLKYKNNGSMCRLLAEYAEKQNQRVIPADPDQAIDTFSDDTALKSVLLTKNLMTVDKKLDLWDRLESSAQMILSAVDSEGVSDYSVTYSVEHFGENVED